MTGTDVVRRAQRLLPWLLLVAPAACADAGPPVLGVATSSSFLDAARLAVADAHERGAGVRFDTVMVGEGGNEAGPAIVTAQRFLDHPRMVAVAGHSNSSASITASQLYNAREVVQVAPHSSAVLYSEAGPYSFRLVPPDDRQGSYLAGALADIRPTGARVALFYVNDDYGRGLRRVLLDALDSERFHVVLDLPHVEQDPGSANTEYAAAALRSAEPDVIVWLGRATILETYLPGLRAAAPSTPILGSDALGAGAQGPGTTALWDGVTHVDFLDLDATPELRDFAARYRARHGRDPTVPDALTYDAVAVLIAGFAAGAVTGPQMRAYLASLGRTRPPHPGITGRIRFDDHGDADRSYVLRTFEAGPP